MINFLFKCFSLFGAVIDNTETELTKSEDHGAVSPIYEFLDAFGPVLISMLIGVGALYCIILGVQYAKAEKGEEREVAKKKAVNAAIGFGVIIILVVLLYAFRGPLTEMLNNN